MKFIEAAVSSSQWEVFGWISEVIAFNNMQ